MPFVFQVCTLTVVSCQWRSPWCHSGAPPAYRALCVLCISITRHGKCLCKGKAVLSACPKPGLDQVCNPTEKLFWLQHTTLYSTFCKMKICVQVLAVWLETMFLKSQTLIETKLIHKTTSENRSETSKLDCWWQEQALVELDYLE